MSLKNEDIVQMAILHKDKFFFKYGLIMQKGQKEFSDSVVRNVLLKTGKNIVLNVARQSGKTTINVWLCAWLLLYTQQFWAKMDFINRGIYELGWGAPQFGQAKTGFDRLKDVLSKVSEDMKLTFEEANGNTLKINLAPYKSVIYIFPVTKGSKIESKTLDTFFGDEAQYFDDERLKVAVFPMTASTNGCKIFSGTASNTLCHFYELCISKSEITEKFIYDADEIVKQKIELFRKTRNSEFLNYKTHYENEKLMFGENSDYIKTQYKLEWILGKGMFVTPEQIDKICLNIPIIKEDKINDVYIGIDCAKENDDMVVTAWRWQLFKRKEWKEPKQCLRILNWYVLNKELYSDQWEIVEEEFLKNYNIKAINIDSTGPGDGTADWFIKKYDNVSYDTYKKREANGQRGIVRGVKFTSQSKNKMYRELMRLIDNDLFIVPKDETSVGFNKFINESKILLKEYKGDLLSVHHNDKVGATDDCWDSIACSLIDNDIEPIRSNQKIVTAKYMNTPQIIGKQTTITEKWLNKRLNLGKSSRTYI